MRIVRNPKDEDLPALLKRPSVDAREIEGAVRKIINDVKLRGDEALREYTAKFDRVAIEKFRVSSEEIAAAEARVPDELKGAIKIAKANIEKFHAGQREEITRIDTMPGVTCWRKSVAIEKVGLYVPGGTAPLISTVLMLGIPAALAGCGKIVLCSPPDKNGNIADAILYAAKVCGITDIFKVGGAQAIAALAYGTEQIPPVDKIFGPGNQYVTLAKQIVSMTNVAIDMPAGPSEVAVVADGSCVPAFVAADLLSQAEHGADSQVLLATTNESVIDNTLAEIERQIECLPRKEIARASLENSKVILVDTVYKAVEIVNYYAAEHLILAIENAEAVAEKIINAGSVFIGNYSCESAGDYASGTNHTLPTNGYARAYSGVSLDSFFKKITFQKLSEEGIANIGPAIECLAEAEGLNAHKNAVTLRLEAINGI
jgi:histidinol dehydrogenase